MNKVSWKDTEQPEQPSSQILVGPAELIRDMVALLAQASQEDDDFFFSEEFPDDQWAPAISHPSDHSVEFLTGLSLSDDGTVLGEWAKLERDSGTASLMDAWRAVMAERKARGAKS